MITSEDIEGARSAITYDDGQNVFIDGMKACPWCGEQADESLRPYVQVGPTWPGGLVDVRVVCPVCHVSTARVTASRVMADEARRALAVAAAVVACLAALPMLPVFLVARAITPRGDDEGGYFKW